MKRRRLNSRRVRFAPTATGCYFRNYRSPPSLQRSATCKAHRCYYSYSYCLSVSLYYRYYCRLSRCHASHRSGIPVDRSTHPPKRTYWLLTTRRHCESRYTCLDLAVYVLYYCCSSKLGGAYLLRIVVQPQTTVAGHHSGTAQGTAGCIYHTHRCGTLSLSLWPGALLKTHPRQNTCSQSSTAYRVPCSPLCCRRRCCCCCCCCCQEYHSNCYRGRIVSFPAELSKYHGGIHGSGGPTGRGPVEKPSPATA